MHIRCRERREEKKKQRVRRNVKIKIDETMQEQRATCSQRSCTKRTVEFIFARAQIRKALAEKQHSKSQSKNAAGCSRLREQFQIIVVRMSHRARVIGGFILRKDCL